MVATSRAAAPSASSGSQTPGTPGPPPVTQPLHHTIRSGPAACAAASQGRHASGSVLLAWPEPRAIRSMGTHGLPPTATDDRNPLALRLIDPVQPQERRRPSTAPASDVISIIKSDSPPNIIWDKVGSDPWSKIAATGAVKTASAMPHHRTAFGLLTKK